MDAEQETNPLKNLMELDEELADLKKYVKELAKTRETLLSAIIVEGIQESDSYVLKRKTRTRDTIRIPDFIRTVGKSWMDYATVSITKANAEKILSKSELADVCDTKEYESFSVMKRKF